MMLLRHKGRRDWRTRVLWAYAAVFALVNVAILLAGSVQAVAAGSEPSRVVRIVALGDSLMAGYNLPKGQAVPDHLSRLLADSPLVRDNRLQIEMINGGLSGDTSAGGLARLDWMLTSRPDLMIVELGANDALRGLSPDDTRLNLTAIIQKLQEEKVQVVLAGMLAPPNIYSEADRQEFDGLYPELAAEFGVELYPFFLDGVAAVPALLQKDGMHPNAKGTEVMAKGVLPHVEAVIRRVLDDRGL